MIASVSNDGIVMVASSSLADSTSISIKGVNGGQVLELGKAVELTLERKRKANLRPLYLSGLRWYLRLFAKGREDAQVTALTAADVEQWFCERNEAPATQKSNLGRLSALFRTCIRLGIIASNPCDSVERIIIEHEAPKILAPAQCEIILARTLNAGEGLAYLTLCLFAGLRPNEARFIRWEDICLQRGLVRVSAAVSKIRRRRLVHLEPAAIAWLRHCEGVGLPFSLRAQRRWRKRAASWLALNSWPHDVLRHSAASYWLAEWRDAGRVAHELGNSPSILLRHYRELVTPEEAREFWSLRPRNGHQLELEL